MSVAERLGVPETQIQNVDLLNTHALPTPDALFDQAFSVCQSNPEEGQLLLAAALLSQAQHTPEGRLSGALSLLAPLVARADPMKTLGPEGAALRSELLPSGWKAMSQSWEKLRYAWREREGLPTLLDVRPDDQTTVQALNEITRLHPAEPEPVSVAIQESFPAPRIAFAVTVLGMAFTLRTVIRDLNRPKRRR